MSLRCAASFGLLITALVAVFASSGRPAGATFPGSNGKIAFVRYIEGGSYIL